MSSETLHSTMKATMNEARREVMFCNITDILSAIADFTSAASVAKRAASRLELFSSSSNHPISFLKIAEKVSEEEHCLLANDGSRMACIGKRKDHIILARKFAAASPFTC